MNQWSSQPTSNYDRDNVHLQAIIINYFLF